MDHSEHCRLLEVSCRLRAIQQAARTEWSAADVAKVLASLALLSGYAGVHLGYVLEYGCDCSVDMPAAA